MTAKDKAVQELAGYFYLDDGQWKQAHDPVSFPGCTKLYTTPPAAQPAPVHTWRDALERIADPRNVHFSGDAQVVAREALATAPVQEPAFHGFMDKENCCVHICYTPWAPRMTDGKFATAYYTTPPAAQPALKPLTKTRVGNHLRRHQHGEVGMYRNGFKDGVQYAEAVHGIKGDA